MPPMASLPTPAAQELREAASFNIGKAKTRHRVSDGGLSIPLFA
jgi:hypothetical protein